MDPRSASRPERCAPFSTLSPRYEGIVLARFPWRTCTAPGAAGVARPRPGSHDMMRQLPRQHHAGADGTLRRRRGPCSRPRHAGRPWSKTRRSRVWKERTSCRRKSGAAHFGSCSRWTPAREVSRSRARATAGLGKRGHPELLVGASDSKYRLEAAGPGSSER